jgi:biopolymer transport protein TolR
MSVGAKGGSSGGRGRRRGGSKKAPMSEINVTPMVDVMLVLLIIFMVAAPLMTVGVPVTLPETKASEMNSDSKPITISVDKDGKVFLQEEPIAMDEILGKLKAIANTGNDQRIFVRADAVASYGSVAQVMGLINSAGYHNIGLMMLPATQQ